MKMRKKIFILSIILSLIIVLVLIILNFSNLYRPKTESEYLTDIDQLYSSFTDYMREKVDSHLQLLGCEPKEYYYDDSNLCFVCGDIHSCLSHTLTDEGERVWYQTKAEPEIKTEPEKTGPEDLTDIDKLYSSFTDSMKAEVGSYLQSLACEPKEYYYDNSALCFVCEDIYPCFGYAWVDKGEEGVKRNSKDIPYITGIEELDIKVADFCKVGLASEFDCQKTSKDSLGCEKIRFLGTSTDGVFKCKEVKLVLKEGIELKDFANDFCRLKEKELGETTESSVACEEYLIGLIENREIIIGITIEEG